MTEETEETFEFKLSKPINVMGDMVDTLKWRKPNGSDLIRIGNPVIFSPHMDPPKIEHDMNKMVAMIAKLTNSPSSSIERMEPRDFMRLAWDITPFFMPGA